MHVATAALPVGWGLGVLSPELLRSLLLVGLAIAILVEGARQLSRRASRLFDATFGSLLRQHERADITGATWLLAAMLGSVLLFPPATAVVALWAVAAGDGAASIVGRLASHASERTAVESPDAGTSDRRPRRKTLAGSLACTLVTAAGAAWLADLDLVRALAVGVVVAVVEWPRGPLDDNLRVAAAAGLAAWALGAG